MRNLPQKFSAPSAPDRFAFWYLFFGAYSAREKPYSPLGRPLGFARRGGGSGPGPGHPPWVRVRVRVRVTELVYQIGFTTTF